MTNDVPLNLAETKAPPKSERLGGTRSVWPVALTFVAVDLSAAMIAVTLSVLLRSWAGGNLTPQVYEMLLPSVILLLVCFAVSGLYPGIAINAVVELRRIVKSTSIAYLIVIAALYFGQEGLEYSRGVMALDWVLSIVLVVAGRRWARSFCTRFSWWGVRSVLIDTGWQRGAAVALDGHRKHGLHVVATVPCMGIAHLGSFVATHLALPSGEPYAYGIVLMSGVRGEEATAILDECSKKFRHTLLVADLPGLSSFAAEVKDLGGSLCVELPHNLLSPVAQTMKRIFDVVSSALLMVLLSPLLLLISAAIALTSRGPVFYSHERIGYEGRPFRVWKFRTMVQNAETVLARHLEQHPELEQEWQKDQKLRRDPRSTRVGKWLRKSSLDELPQLWNVFLGEMSLVGPRPITYSEVSRYGRQFELYKRVMPGLTGLWQISGRNNTTYQQRVEYDEFYVRNWSVWMDLHIMIMTTKTVVTTDGAY